MKKLFRMFVLFLFILVLPTKLSHAAVTSFFDLDGNVPVTAINPSSNNEVDAYKIGHHYAVSLSNETGYSIEDAIPIAVTTPGVLKLQISNAVNGAAINGALFSDSDCQKQVSYFTPVFQETYISTAATYYLKIFENQTDAGLYLHITTSLVGANEFTANTGHPYVIALKSLSAPQYIPFSVTGTRKITATYSAPFGGYVTLCNSSKMPLTDAVYVNESTSELKNAVFAVKKGTYYLMISSPSNVVTLSINEQVITEKSGTKKEKAGTIKKGKKVLGTSLITDSSGKIDWYKVTLKKDAPVTLKFNSNISSGLMQVTIYGNQQKYKRTFAMCGMNSCDTIYLKDSKTDKLPKGTYYIQIKKSSQITSGDYSIEYCK